MHQRKMAPGKNFQSAGIVHLFVEKTKRESPAFQMLTMPIVSITINEYMLVSYAIVLSHNNSLPHFHQPPDRATRTQTFHTHYHLRNVSNKHAAPHSR